MKLFTEEYLAHHGILGQKWGVRRYQNKDGSLTRAGKLRQKSKDSKMWARVHDANSRDYKTKGRSASGKSKYLKKAVYKYGEIAEKNLAKSSSRDADKYSKKAAKAALKEKGQKIVSTRGLYRDHRGNVARFEIVDGKTGEVYQTYADANGNFYGAKDNEAIRAYRARGKFR